MALIKVTYASDVMKRQISLSAHIPIDNGQPRPEYGYRTLVMLHGLTADGSSWIRESDIEAMARERNLAVLFPSGENSFYVQGLAPNSDYGELVGREIVEFARGLFPLSARREDTFIGGLSMGGFGALRNGLKYADTFARVISFSAAIHMFEFEPGDPRRHMVCHEDMVMGDYATARQTDRNPAVCLEALKARVDAGEGSYPGIYMICGIDDDLIDANRSFRDRLLAAGVPVRYREGPGRHDFAYWNANLPDLLDWMLADEDRA